MKIKSYRAASLREALIQIKQELGEDALVIETKQVRAGGFLGVGARNLVEVRVAPNPKQETEQPRQAPAARQQKGSAKINLTEDSAATPAPARGTAPAHGKAPARGTTPARAKAPAHAATEDDGMSFGTFSALIARAYAGNGSQQATAAKPSRTPERAPKLQRQGIELADTAPRIVHRRPGPKPAVSSKEQVSKEQGPEAQGWPSQAAAVNGELARLRAELREVKFALGAFAPRHGARREPNVMTAFEDDPTLYDSPYYETYLELTAAGLAPELARQAVKKAIPPASREARGFNTDFNALARAALATMLPAWLQFAEAPMARRAVAAFIGPTGVGKTTTIAKLAAHLALRARQRVELITLDTYRIAAVQQLKTYAELIGAGCHVARSVVELEALTRRFAGEATVLIDTIGRSPHDLADQIELADYLRGNPALLKCLVLPATTHLNDAQLALDKFALYGANRLVLTKLDETVQPGAAVNVAALAALPLLYLCAGQRVPEDLERATPASFATRVVRPRASASAA